MNSQGTRFTRRRGIGALVGLGLLALVPGGVVGQASVTTVAAGTLTVGYSESKPISYVEGDKLTGVDGDLINLIATNLGLTVTPVASTFEESLDAAKAGTVDVAIGDIFGTAERATMFALTDPVYYNATLLAVKNGVTIASVEDLAGKTVGTGKGFATVPDLQKIPGITEVKEYDTAEAAIADVVAGTIDAVVLDPPVISYALAQTPGAFQIVKVDFDAATYPVLGAVSPAVFAVNPANPDLAAAISAEIAKLWKDGTIKATLDKYGLIDPSYTTAPEGMATPTA